MRLGGWPIGVEFPALPEDDGRRQLSQYWSAGQLISLSLQAQNVAYDDENALFLQAIDVRSNRNKLARIALPGNRTLRLSRARARDVYGCKLQPLRRECGHQRADPHGGERRHDCHPANGFSLYLDVRNNDQRQGDRHHRNWKSEQRWRNGWSRNVEHDADRQRIRSFILL